MARFRLDWLDEGGEDGPMQVTCPFEFCGGWIAVVGDPPMLKSHMMPDLLGGFQGETCPASLAPWPLTPEWLQSLHDQKLSMWRRKQHEYGEAVNAKKLERQAIEFEEMRRDDLEYQQQKEQQERDRMGPRGTRQNLTVPDGTDPKEYWQIGGREDAEILDAPEGPKHAAPDRPDGAHYGGIYGGKMAGINELVGKVNEANVKIGEAISVANNGGREAMSHSIGAEALIIEAIELIIATMDDSTSQRLSDAAGILSENKDKIVSASQAFTQAVSDANDALNVAIEKNNEWIGIVTSA